MEKINTGGRGQRFGINRSKYNKPAIDNMWQPFLGATAAICGTALAVISVPDNPQPNGALFWSAVWCSLGFLTVPILGLRTTIRSIFRAENLIMLGLIYWLLLDLLLGNYPVEEASQDDVISAFIAIGAFATGIFVGMLGSGWSPPHLVTRAAKEQFNSGPLFLAICVCFLLGMFYFLYSSDFDLSLMIEALGWCRFCAPWSTGAYGGWAAFLVHLQYFGYILPALTVVFAHREGWLRPKVIVAIVLCSIMIIFLAQGGGRRIIGVVVGAALITWLLLQERIRPKVLVAGSMSIVALLVFMELMLEYRGVGFSSSDEGYISDEALVHIDDNFLRLVQIMQFFPNLQDYVDLQPLFYVLSFPIPRVLWPGKPSDPGYNLSDLLGYSGVSLSQSIVGELYAMHGLIVVFAGGLVYGRLAKMWNKILALPETSKSVIYSIGIMVLFAGLRSLQDLVIMSYALLALLLITSLLRGRAKTVPRLT